MIGLRPEVRKKVFDMMGSLYKVRSDLVHAGDTSALTDTDLKTLEDITYRVLTVVLTRRTFTRMRSASEFERWLDDQLFA